jgi:hypothetical protein
MKKQRIRIQDIREDAIENLSEADIEKVTGGAIRRTHDHIGNFNFKVEIDGVTQAS